MFLRERLIAIVPQLQGILSRVKRLTIKGSKKLRGLLGIKKNMTQKVHKLKKVKVLLLKF
jgi:hypothetical protein